MEYEVINLKENQPTVELAIANLEIELEIAKKYGLKAMKVIHGYGSHGKGGAIRTAVNEYLTKAKKRNVIRDFINGSEWSINSEKSLEILFACPDSAQDDDLGHRNEGVTIILL